MLDDLAPFFVEFGTVATYGEESARVLFDQPSASDLFNHLLDSDYVISLPASEFPALAMDDHIRIDDVSYRVREVLYSADRRIKQVSLVK